MLRGWKCRPSSRERGEEKREREDRERRRLRIDKREILAKIVRTAVRLDKCWDRGIRERVKIKRKWGEKMAGLENDAPRRAGEQAYIHAGYLVGY